MSAEDKAIKGEHLEATAQSAKDYTDNMIAGLATIYASKTAILRATVVSDSTAPSDYGTTIWLRPV